MIKIQHIFIVAIENFISLLYDFNCSTLVGLAIFQGWQLILKSTSEAEQGLFENMNMALIVKRSQG